MKTLLMYKNILSKPLVFIVIIVSLAMIVGYVIISSKNDNNDYSEETTGNKLGLTISNKNIDQSSKNNSEPDNRSIINTAQSKNSVAIIKASLSGLIKPLPLYGFNGETSQSPAWTNQAFRDSVASLRLKVIRYPGGTVSNFWDWKKGLVSSDASTENESATKKDKKLKYIEPHGLKELKLLVNETGCEVVFVLNMVSSELNDQLSMLQTAQSLGIPVKWIELGNEFYLQKSAGRQKFITPANYGKTAEQWITAIKTQFKNAKIAVIGSTGVEDWNEQVLQNAPDADAIVAHLYPVPLNILDDSGINFSKLNNVLAKKINKFIIPEKNFPVWITEYNIHWAATGDKKGAEKKEIRKYAQTWSQALATLLMTSEISTLIGNPQIVLDHNVSNWTGFAAIETEKGTFRKLPNGIGMQAWLTASDNMNQMQKIKVGKEDYELQGWKFSNSATNNQSYLFVNFTGENISIDLSSVLKGKENYQTFFADKNTAINSESDINKEAGVVEKSLQLPAYSITICQ